MNAHCRKTIKFVGFFLWLALLSPGVFAVDLTNEWSSAISAYRQKDYEAAVAHFNEILKVDTNNAMAWMSRGGAYGCLKQYQNAEPDLNEAVQLSTNNIMLSMALFNRGFFHEEVTNMAAAIDDYSKAVQYNPAYAAVYAARARVQFATRAYSGVLQDCNMAIMLDPDSADAYDYRGRVNRQLGKYDRCIADYTKAIELSTNNAWYYYSRGAAFFNQEDFQHAISDFSKALEAGPDDRNWIADVCGNRGFAYSKIGQFDKGIDDCRRGVEANTNSVTALNNLAWLLATAPEAKLRDGKLAVEYAKHCCDLSGWKEPYSLGTLAAAYAEAGDFEEAVKWERKCILIGLPDKDIGQAHKELDLFEQKQPYHADK